MTVLCFDGSHLNGPGSLTNRTNMEGELQFLSLVKSSVWIVSRPCHSRIAECLSQGLVGGNVHDVEYIGSPRR